MRILALLGDSILDNQSYTAPEPDTAEHLRRALVPSWTVELVAQDGATLPCLPAQLACLATPPDVAILSIGGNDAICYAGLLQDWQRGAVEALRQLQDLDDDFALRYRGAIAAVAERVRRLVVCTIYEPPLLDPQIARLARVPLTMLNDRIIREAAGAGVDVLDLRAVCAESLDFVKEIEPSAAGAAKIAAAIRDVVEGGGTRRHARVFAA